MNGWGRNKRTSPIEVIRMIERLSIKNFKSIKDLEVDCRKINLFIGEPNTGKSNILEALGLLSWCGYRNTELKEYVRFQGIQNLFYDDLTDRQSVIEIKSDTRDVSLEIEFVGDNFHFKTTSLEPSDIFIAKSTKEGFARSINKKEREFHETGKQDRSKGVMELNYLGNLLSSSGDFSGLSSIKSYRFVRQDKFPESNPSFLMPPHGSNMFAVVRGNKDSRETMVRFLKDYGFRPVLKPMERIFEFQKQIDEMIFTYPYILLSDTLQRMIFYEIAMESNKDSTLIFEEPESHAFPYYTKYLGERIGFDETNQYFIATHNPYLLLSILEKAKKDSVNIFITYWKDYQTKVKCLNDDEVSELMDYDPFFNLDSFIEEEE